jgi:hypothetical protein
MANVEKAMTPRPVGITPDGSTLYTYDAKAANEGLYLLGRELGMFQGEGCEEPPPPPPPALVIALADGRRVGREEAGRRFNSST